MPYKIRIRWRSPDEPVSGDSPAEYEFTTDAELAAFVEGIEAGFGRSNCPSFATQTELDAFLEGVEVTIGSSDWRRFDPNPDGSWPSQSEPAHNDQDERKSVE
jgi:hypothetical protein